MSSTSIQLSVVIISFNEEHNIRRCINSVQEIADEVVVVDSNSTDKTVQICREMGAVVHNHDFEGHVEQKNYAITKATYPYILSLDADEALNPELLKSIKSVKEKWRYDGYSMNRLTNYCGTWIRHCGWYPDRKLRLWDSRKGSWQGTNPHDEYRMHKGIETGHLKGDILHYSYNTIHDHIAQVNYFTEIGARAGLKQGKRSNLFKILVSPFVKFFRDYLILGGFRDGYYGLVVCMISAHATFLKYVKMKQFQSNADLSDAYSD